MRMRVAVLGTLLVFASACGVPGPSSLRYGNVGRVAGERKAYVEVRKTWTEHATVDGSRERWEHVGVLVVSEANGFHVEPIR